MLGESCQLLPDLFLLCFKHPQLVQFYLLYTELLLKVQERLGWIPRHHLINWQP